MGGGALLLAAACGGGRAEDAGSEPVHGGMPVPATVPAAVPSASADPPSNVPPVVPAHAAPGPLPTRADSAAANAENVSPEWKQRERSMSTYEECVAQTRGAEAGVRERLEEACSRRSGAPR